jgi:hypothetical protein
MKRRTDYGGEVVCVYCGQVTARPGYVKKTVCGECTGKSFRDEAFEVANGLRHWARPLTFWVRFFGQKPMTDEQLAEHLSKQRGAA